MQFQIAIDRNLWHCQRFSCTKSPPELFDGEHGLYYYQGRNDEKPFIVVAPSIGGVDSDLFLTEQRKLDPPPLSKVGCRLKTHGKHEN